MSNQIILSEPNDIILSKIRDIDEKSNEMLTNSIYKMIAEIPDSVRKDFNIEIHALSGRIEIDEEKQILTKGSSEINIKMTNLNK